MGIADPDAALEILEEFCSLLEAEFQNRGQGPPSSWARLNELQPWVVRIARRIDPENVADLEAKSQSGSWRLGLAHTQTMRLMGLVKYEADYRRMLDEGPTLAADRLHAWVWSAAVNLWDDGHYEPAVHEAAKAVELHTQLKVSRRDLHGKDLYSQAFSVKDPTERMSRLRFLHIDRNERPDDWISAHQGAQRFGMGCAQGIRNPQAHPSDDLTEQEALEQLAALSVLARWVEQCRPDPATPHRSASDE